MNFKFTHTLVERHLRRFKSERWLRIIEFISLVIIVISLFLVVLQIINNI
jgi:hypothetical protein